MRRIAGFAALVPLLCFADEIPRAEHPQPQFQREQWMNLNGRWQFEFDDAGTGLDELWWAGTKKFTRAIVVPFAFESPKSGIGDSSFHPVVWYRREFAVPATWKGKRVLLHFGAVDYRARVWLNGYLAGAHEGGNVPFTLEATGLLKPTSNEVIVRAEDPPTDRSIPRGKQYWEPKSRGIFYTRTSGIWQTVWLEAVGSSFLDRVRMTPSSDGTVRFDARVEGPVAGLAFRVRIRDQGRELATSDAAVTGERVVSALAVRDPRLWSPNSPNLYDVTFELHQDSNVIDRVESYLGFRSVGTAGGRVLLNGRPIYLKMVLDQGYWPESLLTPPSDKAIQSDIRMTKEMGFNGARKHQKVEDPRYLYWADKMGLLVSGEMANAYLFDDTYVARFTREWMEAVERDYNHPSVIIWAPINESWGTPNLADTRQQDHLKSLYALTHSLDATRLVIDNEGWEHTDMTDLFAIHDYIRNGELLWEKYKSLGRPEAPIPDGSRNFLIPGYRYNGSPFYLSEFGGIAYIPPGHNVPREAWGYSGVEKSPEAALERMRGLWMALAKMPAFAGLCYTQLTDVEQEVNGLLTYDRKPKFDVKRVREINALVR